jgi:hypothetical protein
MGSAEPCTMVPFLCFARSELGHNGEPRRQPQHSTEVSPQQHDADHEAFQARCSL